MGHCVNTGSGNRARREVIQSLCAPRGVRGAYGRVFHPDDECIVDVTNSTPSVCISNDNATISHSLFLPLSLSLALQIEREHPRWFPLTRVSRTSLCKRPREKEFDNLVHERVARRQRCRILDRTFADFPCRLIRRRRSRREHPARSARN